jgi:hypothetical protein
MPSVKSSSSTQSRPPKASSIPFAVPVGLRARLDVEFGFTVDAAVEPGRGWAGEVVFCVPPAAEKKRAVADAWQAAAEHGATVVLILPATSDTALFWDFCRWGEVRWLTGRLKTAAGRTAPFGSCVVIFRPGQDRSRYDRTWSWCHVSGRDMPERVSDPARGRATKERPAGVL